MVKETRIIFEVKDIRAFRVVCNKCSNEVVVQLSSDKHLPDECPMCKEHHWLVGSRADRLLNILRSINDNDPGALTTVRLEIDGEDA